VSGEEEAQGRFDEAFAILRQGLTSDSVTFDGKYYKLLDAPVTSRPVQRPHPPLWYGTRTPAKAQWCARLGMPMMALVPSQAVRVLTGTYKAEWASLGRSLDDLPPLGISRNMVLAPTSEQAMKIANRAFARFRDSLCYLWKKYDIPMPPVFPAERSRASTRSATSTPATRRAPASGSPAIATSAGSATWRWKHASATWPRTRHCSQRNSWPPT
jgi:alkanesulfonate monooxygenase SsuD/methylene tetrahydromethanopterin reductase-like flavin-dependent oxidoreductase (luciferase family)